MEPPCIDVLKNQCGCRAKRGRAATGVAIRDHNGRVLASTAKPVPFVNSVGALEAQAIIHGFQLAN